MKVDDYLAIEQQKRGPTAQLTGTAGGTFSLRLRNLNSDFLPYNTVHVIPRAGAQSSVYRADQLDSNPAC